MAKLPLGSSLAQSGGAASFSMRGWEIQLTLYDRIDIIAVSFLSGFCPAEAGHRAQKIPERGLRQEKWGKK